MICYNVARRFFPMKSDADRYRVDHKMRPASLTRLDIRSREDLADILNSVAAQELADIDLSSFSADDAVTPAEEPPILKAIHDHEDAEKTGFDPDDPDVPAFLRA